MAKKAQTNHEPPWTLGRKAMVGSLIVAHIWGFMLIIAALTGRANAVVGDMFSTIGFMIFTTLAVLVGGKAWKDFAPMKFGGANARSDVVDYEPEEGLDDSGVFGGYRDRRIPVLEGRGRPRRQTRDADLEGNREAAGEDE